VDEAQGPLHSRRRGEDRAQDGSALLVAGGWNWMGFKVPSGPTTLWLYDCRAATPSRAPLELRCWPLKPPVHHLSAAGMLVAYTGYTYRF